MKKKKLTVGIFTHDFFPIFGGQGRHIYEIYKQNEKHNDITMIIFSPSENNLPNHIQLFPKTKNSLLKNIDFSVQLFLQFEKLIQKHNLDIVHIHGGPGGLFLFKRLSVPTLYTTHHTYWQQHHYIKQQQWKYIFYLLEKRSYTFADRIIAVSTDTKDILETYYNHDVITYIPNGITRTTQVKTTSSKKTKNLLYIGRIDKRKGVDFLVRSMITVAKEDPTIHLHIVGTGKDKEALEGLSKKHMLPITFHGRLSDEELDHLYATVAIQIVPSVFEGFGISVLEGVIKRVPIIATNVDGIKSIIRHHHSGMLVPYGDDHALAYAILHLISNKKLQKELANNAYKELPQYDWGKIYKTTVATYEKLLS